MIFARGDFLEYKPQQHNETKFSLLKAHLPSMFGSRTLYLSPLCTVIVTGVSGCCSLPARSEPDILTPLQRARQAKGNAYKLILSNSCKALIIQMWRILGTILLSESVVKISFLLQGIMKSGPVTLTVTASASSVTMRAGVRKTQEVAGDSSEQASV